MKEIARNGAGALVARRLYCFFKTACARLSRPTNARSTDCARIESRSPEKCSVAVVSSSPTNQPKQTVPTGFRGSPPPGPAMPVIDNPAPAPRSLQSVAHRARGFFADGSFFRGSIAGRAKSTFWRRWNTRRRRSQTIPKRRAKRLKRRRPSRRCRIPPPPKARIAANRREKDSHRIE